MIDCGRHNVLGVNVHAIDYDVAVDRIVCAARNQERCLTSAMAVHGLLTAARDPEHLFRMNAFDLVVPDGQPVRWALNALHRLRLEDRVYGPRLMICVCEEAARSNLPIYLYGSSAAVVQRLSSRLQAVCPGLQVAGVRPSAFRRLTASECAEIVHDIAQSQARILFVGLGCPRQEVFAYEFGQRLKMPILAVGAAFDYHSGSLREPPALVQRLGLQWLYRLLQEPRRLWKRYLITNTQFVTLFLAQWLGVWRPDPSVATAPVEEALLG